MHIRQLGSVTAHRDQRRSLGLNEHVNRTLHVGLVLEQGPEQGPYIRSNGNSCTRHVRVSLRKWKTGQRILFIV